MGPDNAETRLIAIYALIEQGDFHAAMVKSRSLVQDQPNFQLAQLVHGDLLRLRYKPDAPLSDTTHAQLASLRAESRKRLDALRNRPAPETVPHQFVALAPTSRHAIAIDAAHSRLYLFENRTPVGAADKTPPNLQLVADFFISVGKSGIDKRLEGDGRTPLGNYYITAAKDRKSLPAFYGAGALPINYPNAFDNHKGRTGSGIWLHGTPSNTYSRPPKASEGCVVLTNQDLDIVAKSLQVGLTPVIISNSVEWLSFDDWAKERNELNKSIDAWRTDWESRDTERYMRHYSKRFKTNDQSLEQFAAQKKQVNASKEWIKVKTENLSVFRNPGKEEVVVVTFDQDYRSNNLNNLMKKRQYWLREDGKWKIIYEGSA